MLLATVCPRALPIENGKFSDLEMIELAEQVAFPPLSADVSPIPHNKHKNNILMATDEDKFPRHHICSLCFTKANITNVSSI